MAGIQIYNKFSNLEDQSTFRRFISAFLDQVYTTINGKLDFVSNIRASGPSVLGFPNASTIIGVSHGLGFIPNGFLTINLSADSTLYAPQGSSYMWTSSMIFLQASAGVTASIYVI